jgi:hypothetical protein
MAQAGTMTVDVKNAETVRALSEAVAAIAPTIIENAKHDEHICPDDLMPVVEAWQRLVDAVS